MFNFVADNIVKSKAYPALAKWQAQPYTQEWRQFTQHWPNTVPSELIEHCCDHNYPHTLTTDGAGLYIVSIGFFNFSVDYFGLMAENIRNKLQNKELEVLFYYHEGDNPIHIKNRLDVLCQQWQLPLECYYFVSGNTIADTLPRFAYFPDHELLYWRRNKNTAPIDIHTNRRDKDFTVLSRTHKWWRATVITDLYRSGILNNSYWSYGVEHSVGEPPSDNPIEINLLNLQDDVNKFLAGAPYKCDTFTTAEHNNHSLVVEEHYNNSYCHIVLETLFDVGGSGGTFISEKTFKPIKHGQPFIIVGAPGTLKTLRKLGYKTFDHAIDNSYDLETNNTKRWTMILNAIKKIKSQDMHTWFLSCVADAKHNQELFNSSKYNRLADLRVNLNSV